MPSPSNERPKQASVGAQKSRDVTNSGTDFTIGLKRSGCAVQITLTATDDYSAIELFDLLVNSIEQGGGINLGAALSANTQPGRK